MEISKAVRRSLFIRASHLVHHAVGSSRALRVGGRVPVAGVDAAPLVNRGDLGIAALRMSIYSLSTMWPSKVKSVVPVIVWRTLIADDADDGRRSVLAERSMADEAR